MSMDPFEEAHRRVREALGRHRDEMEAARRLVREAMRSGREEVERALRPLRDGLRGLPPHSDLNGPGRRRGKRGKPEPDAGGVPVEPNNPRNLSGGAAAVPETEQ